MRLALGVDIAVPGANVALAVKRAVIATIQRVQWAPEVPWPLPLFTGELVVCGASDFDTFSLRLSGTYAPPLGIFGQGFDLAIGHRIAVATASDLLHRIKISVKRDFQEDEARKR